MCYNSTAENFSNGGISLVGKEIIVHEPSESRELYKGLFLASVVGFSSGLL